MVAAVAFARGGVVVVGRQLGGGVVDVVGGRFVYRRCQVDAAPAGGASGGHSRRPADTTSIVAAPVPLGPPKKKKKGSLGVEKLDDYAVVRRFLNFRIFNRGFWWCGGAADSGSLGKHSSVGLLGRCRTMGHPVESCAPNWVLLYACLSAASAELECELFCFGAIYTMQAAESWSMSVSRLDTV